MRESLTEKIKAILKQDAVLAKIAEADPVSPLHGLSQPEILVLAVIAGDVFMPHLAASVGIVKQSAERAGITSMGFNLAVRRLLQKQMIREEDVWDERDGERYPGLVVADDGWAWIDANDTQFVLNRPEKKKDDLPF
ncbi:MAG: hypothetical protein U1E42_13830 [Rhodospirillales bacterium]